MSGSTVSWLVLSVLAVAGFVNAMLTQSVSDQYADQGSRFDVMTLTATRNR